MWRTREKEKERRKVREKGRTEREKGDTYTLKISKLILLLPPPLQLMSTKSFFDLDYIIHEPLC